MLAWKSWFALLALSLAVSLPGCGKKDEDSKTDGKAGVKLPTAETPIGTDYITEDFAAAVVVHPSRVLNSDLAKEVTKSIEETAGPGKVDEFFRMAVEKTGVDPRNIEQAVVLFDGGTIAQAPAAAFGGGGGATPTPSFVVRMSAPYDQQKLLKAIGEGLEKQSASKGDKDPSPAELIEKTHEGKTYHVAGPMSFCFVDEKTIVGGPEAMLKKMLSAKNVSTPLTKRLASLGAEHDVIIAMAGEVVEQQLQGVAMMMPADKLEPEYRDLPGHLQKLKSVAITASVSSDPMLSLVLQMSDEAAASGLADMANNSAIPKMKEEYAKDKGKMPPEAVKVVDELIAGLAVGNIGTDLVVSLKRPSALKDLPKLLMSLSTGGRRDRPRR